MFSGHRYLGWTIEMEWQKSISPYILFMLKTTLMYCNVIYLLLNVHNNACQYKENIHWLLQTLCRYKLSSALSNCSINLFILSSLLWSSPRRTSKMLEFRLLWSTKSTQTVSPLISTGIFLKSFPFSLKTLDGPAPRSQSWAGDLLAGQHPVRHDLGFELDQ